MASHNLVARATLDTAGVSRGMQDLAREAARLQRETQRVAEQARETRDRFEALRGTLVATAAIGVRQLTQGMTGLSGLFRGLALDITDLTARGVLGLSRTLRALADNMRDVNGDLTLMGKATATAATGMESFARVAITVSNVLLGMKVAAAATAASLAYMSHSAASQFAPAWNRVLVTIGDSAGSFDELRGQVVGLAGDIGVDAVQAANTFYEILGAMPQLLDRPAEALEVLRVSLEAGATGFTNAASAAKANAAVLSAFGFEADQARRVADALFVAQGLGAATFEEIASSISGVSGLTAALGGEFEDLLGIIATLTPTGTSTSEVVTQIAGAISNIIKPSADAAKAAKELGIQFDAAALRAQGLNEFLTNIIEATQGQPDVLARLFGGRQALALLVSLVDKTGELDEYTRQIRESSGATKAAVDQMNDSW